MQSLESKESSFFFIFHAPLEKVYNIFKSAELITATFYQNADIISMKRSTTMDDNGNEFTVHWNHKFPITFRVETIANLPYYKAFRHRSIIVPPQICPFDHTYNFFWNSTDKVTVFKFTAVIKEAMGRDSITQFIFDNKDSMCLTTENYLMTTLTNLEENESISISKPLKEVWSFLKNLENQKYFYPDPDRIKIQIIDDSTIVIEDDDNDTNSTYKITKTEESSEKKQMLMEFTEINAKELPKQKLMIYLIKMDESQCFLIFKHIMSEFIPYDVLMSYSSQKRKILKNIKNVIEGSEQGLSPIDSTNEHNNNEV